MPGLKRTGLMDGAGSEWNEDEHPRGQPDNKGQFVKKDLYVSGKTM